MSDAAGTALTPVDLLVAGATAVAVLDTARSEIPGGWVAVHNGKVDAVGPPGSEPPHRHRIDATGCLVTPGLVNVHHHLWQNLTRAYAPVASADFAGWLGALYPLWATIDEEAAYVSTRVGLAELALGGCTTSSDHLYLQPPGQPSLLDAQIAAARESGIRFHATRGCVDRGVRDGSLMPDDLVESVDDVLADCERLIARHHEREADARVQIAIGPHSVFGASERLMTEAQALAERLDIRLHTHLSGDRSDEDYCLHRYGCRPVEWFESMGWAAPRTWVAHCFFPSPDEVARLGSAGVGVAHCATAGMLMGVGVAPVPALRHAGCPVGLGVDGSSNSDAGSMWLEARTAMLANRLAGGPGSFGARDALEMATLGGAACLGRTGEIGTLEPGANADLAVWPLNGIPWTGAVTDPVAAWLRCGPNTPRHVLVGGQAVLADGVLVADDIETVVDRHHTAARRMQRC